MSLTQPPIPYSSLLPAPNGQPQQRTSRKKREKEVETNAYRLAQRQKQIQYGENTRGYQNFMKILQRDPTIVKGFIPVKPSIHQKCSKRSWDGQVRKWRRALHMYDFVDFDESEEQSQLVRQALIEQTINPNLSPTPCRLDNTSNGTNTSPVSIELTPGPSPNRDSVERVRYSKQDMFALSEVALVPSEYRFPEGLQWLDKRVDLEDDIEDENYSVTQSPEKSSPNNLMTSPYLLLSPARYIFDHSPDGGTPGYPSSQEMGHHYHSSQLCNTPPSDSPRKLKDHRYLEEDDEEEEEEEDFANYFTPLKQVMTENRRAVTMPRQRGSQDWELPQEERENLLNCWTPTSSFPGFVSNWQACAER